MGHAIRAELRQHPLCRNRELFPILAFQDRRFNGVPAGDVRLIGSLKGGKLTVFTCVSDILPVERDGAGGLPLGLQQTVSPPLNTLPDVIHMAGFHIPKIFENIGQRGGRRQ